MQGCTATACCAVQGFLAECITVKQTHFTLCHAGTSHNCQASTSRFSAIWSRDLDEMETGQPFSTILQMAQKPTAQTASLDWSTERARHLMSEVKDGTRQHGRLIPASATVSERFTRSLQ
ncbi:unnamed protein product [Leuciscus chuanchicus]